MDRQKAEDQSGGESDRKHTRRIESHRLVGECERHRRHYHGQRAALARVAGHCTERGGQRDHEEAAKCDLFGERWNNDVAHSIRQEFRQRKGIMPVQWDRTEQQRRDREREQGSVGEPAPDDCAIVDEDERSVRGKRRYRLSINSILLLKK